MSRGLHYEPQTASIFWPSVGTEQCNRGIGCALLYYVERRAQEIGMVESSSASVRLPKLASVRAAGISNTSQPTQDTRPTFVYMEKRF